MRKRLKFTQAVVDKLKPPARGRDEYGDTALPGLELRISAPLPGREAYAVWRVRCRIDGKPVAITIGSRARHPELGAVRKLARKILQEVDQGIDPRRVRNAGPVSVQQVVERYFAEYASKRVRSGYYQETLRSIRRDILPALGDLPIDKLTRMAIREALGKIVARGKTPHASNVLRYFRALLNWAVREELIITNPALGIPDPDPRKSGDRERDRWLSDDEIAAFWRACNRAGGPVYGRLFQLLLLLGCRRSELAEATRNEFDLTRRVWLLPRQRSKNDKEHITHLAAPVIELLEQLPRRGRFLFSVLPDRPATGLSHAWKKVLAEMPGVPHFTIHDLRRSAATGMAELGIGEQVVDWILNHSTRKVSGVARIYNRSEYLPARQAALDAWAEHVAQLIQPHILLNQKEHMRNMFARED